MLKRDPTKPKKCAVCRQPFLMRSAWQKVCGPSCAEALALAVRNKNERKAAAKERVVDRAAREGMKDLNDLIAEAQTAFNNYIRFRDRNLPCICCGKWKPERESLTGGGWDAAHYRARGSAGHLRYHEDNVHRALKRCNTYGHHDYRGGLIAKIGLAAVEALEANNAVHKWSKDEVRAIRDKYKAKLKQLRESACS